MKIFDVCIVGAGASGMLSAQYLSRNGIKVLLVEGNKVLGKKLSMTGNGKCNLTNKNISEKFYHCDDKNFITNVLKEVSSNRLVKLLKDYGIFTIEKENYIYPYSMQAKSVVSSLSHFNSNVIVKNSKKVRDIQKINNIFYVYGERERKSLDRELIGCSKYVIISCGGNSYPKTGSDGSGYKLCQKIGHTIKNIVPSLLPLSCICYDKNLFGIRSDVNIFLYSNDNLIDKSSGEIQFTKDGISGICVFQISKKAVLNTLDNKKVKVICDYLPNLSENIIFDILKDKINNLPNNEGSIYLLFDTLLKDKIIYHILDKENISYDTKIKDISYNKIMALIKHIKNDIFYIDNKFDFKNAQVTGGGVSVSEVKYSMESKIMDNMYMTGEILDVDGLCGGYNLHFAFSSAIIASEDIIKKENV